MVVYVRSKSIRAKSPPKVIYAAKASCVVLCPDGRTNLAQFCMLLITIDKQVQAKKDNSPEQKDGIKIKGSLIGELFYKVTHSYC